MQENKPASNASTHTGIHCFAYGDDLVDQLARQIIAEQQNKLPDLTQVTVLLPDLQAATRLRRRLLIHAQAHGANALLGPEINTFSAWVKRQPNHKLPVLSEHQRELMLVEALIRHPYLYGEGNPWMLADSLLELFDELNEIHFQPPAELDDFLAQLGAAYGMDNTQNESLAGEARLVHTLWQAWHQQMREEGVLDRHADQLLKLGASRSRISPSAKFYLAGFSSLSPPQGHWLQTLMDKQQVEIFLPGENPPATINGYHTANTTSALLASLDQNLVFPEPVDNYERFIFQAFDSATSPIQERARQTADALPESPLTARLKILEATSAEEEAQAVDLQIRLWWLEGKRNIGIVTENRRLARRIRALLERAGIQLQDTAGWALSTTSAAAILERWLQTVEEDFAYQPLLDLLKSPFLLPAQDREALLSTVYRFEQGIVLKENIARSLSRYRQHINYRKNRLTAELAAEYEDISSLLDILGDAMEPLSPFLAEGKHAPGDILAALQQSLASLGLTTSLVNDAAGQRILEELQQMQAAIATSSLRMSWSEFRTWLGRTLERFNFQPPAQASSVKLMSLAQSSLCRFDALIIAGAEREYLPGGAGASPFFNDGVRQALGLTSRSELLSQKLYQFRQLLSSAPNILLTRRSEQDGEDILPSPWLERLQVFHRITYNDDLLDKTLSSWASHPDAQVTDRSASLPRPVPANPSVSIDSSLVPNSLSASAYQQLIDCPYQFFASRCLKLTPPESIREMLEKSDYGERVHLCLHAFHSDVSGLPGPFGEIVSTRNQQAAIECLGEIAAAVFARDLEDNFLHRGWLKRWQDAIPHYVAWQLERQLEWHVKTTEAKLETPLANSGIKLSGRLDRIDTRDQGLGIIDYKTSIIPAGVDQDILAGEAVQLPFYVLLAEPVFKQYVERVEYLPLDNQKLKARGNLENEALHDISQENSARIQQLFNSMHNGEPLPAWGDTRTCAYCKFSGICRREVWDQESGNDNA